MASRKGVPNKIGAQVKENVVAVFNRLGGTAEMANWAQRHKTEFYRLYARLLPTESVTEIIRRDATELSDNELANIATGSSTGAAGETPSEAQLN